MAKIFIIMGKSSSGKDTLYKKLIEDDDLNLKNVVMYTTRPIRSNEIDGVSYHFTDEDKLTGFINENKLVELREYNTVHGVWKYITVDDGQIVLDTNNYLVIGTLEVFNKYKLYYGKDVCVPIYIEVEDGLRLARALERERMQRLPKYAELCRRFLADNKDFSEENIEAAGIEKRYINTDIEECFEEIKKDIEKIL